MYQIQGSTIINSAAISSQLNTLQCSYCLTQNKPFKVTHHICFNSKQGQVIMHLTCFSEVTSWNLQTEPSWGFQWFSSAHPGNIRTVSLLPSFHVVSNSSFTNYHTVSCVWMTTDGVWIGNWIYYYDTIANSYTLQFTTTHIKFSQFDFTSRFLVTDPNNVLCLLPYRLANVSQLTKLCTCPVYNT
jgi:hypothetical protein